jgi:hypothetical protein
VKEDDPRNPGVIADCTGDNAGDSVGPTADGFETYGVTGVALISFITLAIPSSQSDLQAKLIVWIFAMRFLMDFMSGASYFINQAISEAKYLGKKHFNFEAPSRSDGAGRVARDHQGSLVATRDDHQLRHVGRGIDSRVHEGVYQLPL